MTPYLPLTEAACPPHAGTIGQYRESVAGSRQVSLFRRPVDTDAIQASTSESPTIWLILARTHLRRNRLPPLVGVQTRGSQTNRPGAVGSPVGHDREDVIEGPLGEHINLLRPLSDQSNSCLLSSISIPTGQSLSLIRIANDI